jgi:hypothetical protein
MEMHDTGDGGEGLVAGDRGEGSSHRRRGQGGVAGEGEEVNLEFRPATSS